MGKKFVEDVEREKDRLNKKYDKKMQKYQEEEEDSYDSDI